MAISGHGSVIRWCKKIYNSIENLKGSVGNGDVSVSLVPACGTFESYDYKTKEITATGKGYVMVEGAGDVENVTINGVSCSTNLFIDGANATWRHWKIPFTESVKVVIGTSNSTGKMSYGTFIE